jgi:sec-independent protein translocase protein TatA
MPFDIAPIQLLFVLIVALIVFGPKRIPEIGKGLGKGIRDFRKSVTGHDDDDDDDVRPRKVAAAEPTPTVTGQADSEGEIVFDDEEARPAERAGA